MKKQNLSRNWRFHLNNVEGSRWANPDFSTWHVLDLPHDWSIEQPRDPRNVTGDSGGWFPMGVGWYQKSLEIKPEWRGKKIIVEFEGVYMNAEVWLNKHCLGRHPYGYTGFTFDLSPYIEWDGENSLKVFVDNGHLLNSRWYSGSGIYRPVWLIVAEPVHIAHWGINVTTPQVSTKSAMVRISTEVDNESDAEQTVSLKTRLIAADGLTVATLETVSKIGNGSRFQFQQEALVSHPKLWSPDFPNLYQAETEISINGKIVDTESTTFGIRSLEFSVDKGFLLNGAPMLLKGGCVHHDNGILGAASYRRSEERKVEIHKASGFNAIRCAHNPPAPAFLEACDRLGMLVIDEAFDCWRDGKNNGDYHVAFDDWWQRDLEAMLRRDRNHPSIILWSIGNELMERGRLEGYEISQRLAEQVRSLEPTRPVTAAICGSWHGEPWTVMDLSFATLDVGGYNYMWKEYRSDAARLPGRIMMGTESFALEAFENWQAVEELPAVIGDFVWTSLDYLGEAGIGRVHFAGEKFPFLGGYPWHQANCGDLDLCGFKRPQSYYRDTLWHNEPRLYIAVHPNYPADKTPGITLWGWADVRSSWNWAGHEGETFKVEIYSNCAEVELFCDDQSLGRKACSRTERFRTDFEVDYRAGTLRAIGYNSGKPVTEQILATTGPPAKIKLTVDRDILCAGEADLCYVTIEVVDAAGRLHPDAENNIFLTVKGAGQILAVGSANPTSEELYVGNQRKVYRGRALVVVKSTDAVGEIKLTAQADGLDGTEVIIKTVDGG
jgi:beta-galactosidase